MLRLLFLIVGILFIFAGDFGYLADTIKGRVKPNRVTWLLWGVMPVIIYFAELSRGVGAISLLTLATGIVPFAVFTATYFNRQSIWKLTKFDLTCGVLSMIGIVLWYLSKNGDIAIMFSILADIFVLMPTLKKSFTNPETESVRVYILNSIGGE